MVDTESDLRFQRSFTCARQAGEQRQLGGTERTVRWDRIPAHHQWLILCGTGGRALYRGRGRERRREDGTEGGRQREGADDAPPTPRLCRSDAPLTAGGLSPGREDHRSLTGRRMATQVCTDLRGPDVVME